MMTTVMAQTPNIRYVSKSGAYANDGKSWGSAKNNIQDAINDLVDNGLTGEVWVAEGTYTPTESTESSGGSTLYMAFKIPAGITVKGGFKKEVTASDDGVDNNTTRPKKSSKLMGDGGMYLKETILSGRLASTPETFTFDDQKQVFTPKFYGNTYHVVWFAMNGFDGNGRANALTGGKATLEGCIIEGGHANNNDLTGRKHNAYGGGIYMVDGAVVQDCEIRHCDASRDGGGVYMDGGGLLKHSYIHDCQALGVGTDSGFGGGVCLEGLTTPSSTMNVIMQSVVSNNVGRFGGGLAMKVNNTANRTKLAASSVLVNNNTATTATGGVFLYKGGAISGMTIVRNRCNGKGTITNGIQSGRAGGLFAYDKANIANTVIWGNQCDANNDIQYASERSANNNALKPDMKFCSLSRADLCDWSGTVKTSVRSLHDANRETDDANVDHSMGYALFENPTIKAGYIENLGVLNYGLSGSEPTDAVAEKPTTPIDWEVFSESALHHAGIQNIDIDKEGETDSPMETYDIRNNPFNPRVTLGAYVAPAANIHPDATTIPGQVNFYVDPNYVFGHHNQTAWGNGHSWDNPTRYLANVLWLIKKNEVTDKDGNPIDLSDKTVNIYIKEGTINNTNSYEKNKRVRNVAIEVPSNVNIYGGYPAENKDQSLEGRNPRLHQTVISGEIMGDFMTNVSHLVTLTDASNVLIDGVQIRNANATSDLLGAEGRDGAALTIKGGSGIVFKNVLVANNAAHKGAAVYAENTTASFENCIFHNNTSSSELKTNGLLADGNPTAVNGIIYSTGTAQLTFNHCDVLRNVGYASVHEGSNTNTWNNTVFYGNLSKAVENTNTEKNTNLHANALPAFYGSGAVTGANCMFDAKSASFNAIFTDKHSKFDLSYDLSNEANYPRFINPTRNSGHSIGGDVTFYGRSTSFEPHNLNPMVNAASHAGEHTAWGTDMSTVTTRDFGGLPDIGAIENHQNTTAWENAYRDGQVPYGTVAYVRDYATENGTTGVDTYDYNEETGEYVKNAEGKGKYNVKHELLNGSSWEYALNGNAPYAVETIQENTFVLSYMDGTTQKWLGYDKTTKQETVTREITDADGNPVRDGEGNIQYETVTIDVQVPDMKPHPEHTGNTNWYRMSTTATKANAVHFYVKNNKIYFDLDGKTYGIGYSTKGDRRTIVFIENFNNSNNFVTAPAADDNTYCRVGDYWFYVKNNGGELYLEASNTGNAETKQAFALKHDETEVHGNGLMYAVIKARENNIKTVHVAKGEYTNTATNEVNGQKYAYIMEEGVDVLGGYPETGNPGEDERNPKLYETILQIQKDAPLWKGDESADTWDMLKPANNGLVASVGRVLVQPNNFSEETKWDGFTIRHGFLHSWYRQNIRGNIASINTANIGHAGGAGVYLMGNGVLENCEIKDNAILVIADKNFNQASSQTKGSQAGNSPDTAGGFHQAGAGVYMTGTDAERGTIKNSVISGNQLLHKYWKTGSDKEESAWMYGAGLYQDNGTVFNTLIKDNEMRVIKGNTDSDAGNGDLNEVLVGAGAFLVKGEFYNNTIVNNKTQTFAQTQHNRHVRIPGVYVYNSMAMYNSIVAGNVSLKSVNNVENTGGSGTKVFDVPVCSFNGGNYTPYANNVAVHYSFIDVTSNDSKNICKLNDEGSDVTKRTNIYLDSKGDGNYNLSEIFDAGNNYRLIASSPCFNAGTESIKNTNAHPDGPDSSHPDWQEYITIPDEDADYTFRIKDCRIDIGAYEFNGAVGIFPQEFAADGTLATAVKPAVQAVYYVTPNGYGTRAANDPENAACAQKLQMVIDAAGRYKFENPKVNVVVKVANGYDYLHPTAGEPANFKYYATRSTNKADENVRVWSIIIPRGVEVWGGYSDVTLENGTPKVDGESKRIWTNADNGFYAEAAGVFTSRRNITATPTYFDSYYENKLEHSTANCYHVVTFSDRVFDPEGNPYMADETDKVATGALSSYDPMQDRAEELFLHMSDVIKVGPAVGDIKNTNLHRAVLDGIFVTGGKADAQGAGESTSLNINQYGGAAIVTDYAHVRNCILQGNNANNGGALALTHKAVVSGTLMLENTANQNGGALYVFEEGATLSDGTVINSLNNNPGTGEYSRLMDANMAHVFTSTVVNNSAPNGAGGGIWFTEDNQPNVRVNSSVFWQNTALDQANVFGMFSPEKPTTDQHSAEEFYPFAYSAIQNIRASGTNNFSVEQINSQGVRFANTATDGQNVPVLDDDLNANNNISPLYGLIGYSTLTHTGMPVNDYQKVVENLAVAPADYMGVSRTVNGSAVPRTYVEVGARAIDKMYSTEYPMYRLFVAKDKDVDMLAAKGVMQAGAAADATEQAKYYAQEGSSFAYPFQSLQDALDYIHLMRFRGDVTGAATYDANGKLSNDISGKVKDTGANNIPFEIIVSRGTYYPKRDLVGSTDHALASSFTIPEGVSIYGGFLCTVARGNDGNTVADAFYGKGYSDVNVVKAKGMNTLSVEESKNKSNDIFANVTKFDNSGSTDYSVSVSYIEGGVSKSKTYTIMERSDDYITSRRHNYDLNANSIIEPWEFQYQTILSGDAEGAANNGTYHVVTAVPDENVVGVLPVANQTYKDPGTEEDQAKYGMEAHMKGQLITLDGLQIQGGYAFHYVTSAFTDDSYSDYNYYHGGGMLVDGNRYCDTYYGKSAIVNGNKDKVGTVEYKHIGRTNAVCYRDIPVNLKNCHFVNNRGGFGGAVSTNTTTGIFQSSFEQNQAVGMTEKIMHNSEEKVVHYPGNGGAIHSTYELSVFNTLFANNEAKNEGTPGFANTGYRIKPEYFHTLRNESSTREGLKILSGAGGAISVGKVGVFHIMNCDFVKNKANMYPAVFTMNPNYGMGDDTNVREYSQFANTVFWGNEVNEEMVKRNASYEHLDNFKFASKLICNYKRASQKSWDAGKTVFTDYNPEFTATNVPQDQAALDAIEDGKPVFQEVAWFSAYEENRGKSVNHNVDMRAQEFNPFVHFDKTYMDGTTYQNCNVLISSENSVLEGPNFVNPSHEAGVDGYVESADWSPARINNLTDNGSGIIKQTIKNNDNVYTNSFNTYTTVPERSVVGGAGAGKFTDENIGDFDVNGIYATARYYADRPDYRNNIPAGNDKPYMHYVKNEAPIYRISFDPNPSHDQTYVDIGVYEYVHAQLNPNTGDEVDILWVSTDEKPENGIADGSEWSQPTSDLQRAIETLLASRNGHRKEIRLMDGTFTPIYTIENNLSFYIDTYKLNGNVILPENQAGTDVEQYLGVKSLTIKGGYSRDLENEYDVERYPAIIKGQQRTNETSTNWNHAFYIKDATQRYGLKGGENAYKKENGYGSTITGITGVEGKDKVTTIPIEIDGVTFINDQAQTTAEGAALYYEAQSRTIGTGADEFNNTTTGTSAAGVNYKVVKYYQDPEHTIESPDNVPTLYATYNGVTVDDNPYAISISKCKFYDSGDRDQTKNTSAVYIGTKGAISALIYNNVFQNNFGNPLVAYNATTINNTYGLNGGYVELKNDGSTFKSSILNSALWRNNANTGIYGNQAKIETVTETAGVETITATKAYGGASHVAPSSADDKAVFNNNALTMNSAIVEPTEANGFNASLAEENTDLFNGPNFIDPLNADHSKANFNLHAGFRLLNTGLDANYNKNVVTDPNVAPTSAVFNSACNIYEYAWDPTTDKDAALNQRFVGRIDIGAYEYQSPLQRVFYIDPNVITAADADGSTWEKRLGKGSIQNAINMAGLYHNANKGHEGYVFIKGASATNKGLHTEETVIPRNGVKVFGSLPAGYLKMAWEATHEFDPDEDTKRSEQDELLDDYEAMVINDRLGLAEPTHNGTIIEGIKTSTATAFDSGIAADKGMTVIDGFEVMAIETDAEGQVAEPVININPKDAGVKNLALRNLIVHDNKVNTTADLKAVAFVDKALIYEVLMRDNTVNGDGSVLKLGQNGYAVNVTVEGKTLGAGDSETQYNAGTNIYNSLVNYAGHADTENTLSGYNYQLEDPNLNYQLTEMSNNIDACAVANPVASVPQIAGFIDYAHDRDLLGNPRMMYLADNGKTTFIDRGAFETWKVEKDVLADAGDVAGDGSSVSATTHDGWTGFHYYPHTGSVVYVMENKSLVLDGDGVTNNAIYRPYELTPGFLLIQKGASLYGNDKKVNAAYVAVERMIKKDGSIVALPYAMKYKQSTEDAKNIGAAAPAYSAAVADKGVLSFSDATAYAYNYSGSKRSAWDYIFARKDENATSDCWIELTSADNVTGANIGALYVANGFGESEPEKLIRFTAKGENMADYIYTENGVSKTVLLQKYDDAESTNNGADFTNPLDMGWNCFGIPYLVSEYEPYEKVTADAGANTVAKDPSGTYSMSRSHTLWLYYDKVGTGSKEGEIQAPDGTKVDGDGGYYSVKSWLSSDNLSSDNPWHVTDKAQQAIWVGEGIFTQTATLDDTESLVFYRPIYTAPTPGGGSGAKGIRIYGDPTGIEEVMAEDAKADDVELVGTEYYTTDGMQLREPRRGTIVIIKRIYSNGAVKATKQYVK